MTSPLAGEVAERSEVGGGNRCGAVPPSVGSADSIPIPSVPAGHLPLTRGVGPRKGGAKDAPRYRFRRGGACPSHRVCGNLFGRGKPLPYIKTKYSSECI